MTTATVTAAVARSRAPAVAYPQTTPGPRTAAGLQGRLHSRLHSRLRGWLLRNSSRKQNDTPTGTAAGKLSTAAPWGDRSIHELFQHRRLALVRLALLLVDDLGTAEDVVQDAFTALYRRHGDSLAGLDDPDAYLRTSVVNAGRSVLR